MSDNPPSLPISTLIPWIDTENKISLGCVLTLRRNLGNFKFPGKIQKDKKKQILSLLSKEISSNSFLEEPRLILANEMKPIEKEFLIEHFLSMQSFAQSQEGEGFILDKSGKFLATINIEDHLSFWKIEESENIEKSWNQLAKLESDLSKNLNFAFSPRFGFLTSEPGYCGTGLIIYSFLHLPALIYLNQFDEAISKAGEEGVVHSGFQGAPNEIIGDIVVLHNNFTLGLTEENIITSLRSVVTKLISAEKSARRHILEQESTQLKDKVSRAYAILLHSYQIDAIEALNAVSLLKLGLDLGWLLNATHAQVNTLLFASRRAHLMNYYNQNLIPEEIPHKRSEFIHKTLKGIELKI
jgi:protein arginine kinase